MIATRAYAKIRFIHRPSATDAEVAETPSTRKKTNNAVFVNILCAFALFGLLSLRLDLLNNFRTRSCDLGIHRRCAGNFYLVTPALLGSVKRCISLAQ